MSFQMAGLLPFPCLQLPGSSVSPASGPAPGVFLFTPSCVGVAVGSVLPAGQQLPLGASLQEGGPRLLGPLHGLGGDPG